MTWGFGARSERPRNWYDMSYDQQREWERNERRHQDEIYDAERRERAARAAEREELSEEVCSLRSDLDNVAAERDALIDMVREFRRALQLAGRVEHHATTYVTSKVLVPLSDDERQFWSWRRICRRVIKSGVGR